MHPFIYNRIADLCYSLKVKAIKKILVVLWLRKCYKSHVISQLYNTIQVKSFLKRLKLQILSVQKQIALFVSK